MPGRGIASKSFWFMSLVAILVVACAGPDPGTSDGGPGGTDRTSGPKRIVAGILGDPYTLSQNVNSAGTGSIRGVGEVGKLIHAGVAIADSQGVWHPQLAEAVPSLENGLWRVDTDGRMETIWKLKQTARWHDGTPVQSADLWFTLIVGQDKDLALTAYPGYASIEAVEMPDEQTVRVLWKRPFIEADRLFTHEFALPFPRHLLEGPYLADKATFLEIPYWTTDFVGAGPFRVRDFVRNSHMMLQAYDNYVLGRPKADEIVVKFLSDPNTLIANLLAGEVQVTIGRGLNLEQAIQVAGQWPDGRMESKPANWIAHYPQLLTPNPAIIGDARFRRALLHSMDRKAMSDSLQAGEAPIAHTWYEYGAPDYRDVERFVVKYDYDPRRATQIVEELGYIKGPDGFFRDGAGQPLVVQSMTNAGDDVKEKMVLVGADYWKAIGVGVETVLTPRQRASDREYRATFPGFDLVRQPFEPERVHGSEAATPENRFSGKNRTRYMNPELDSLIDRYFTTIPTAERLEVLGSMLHIMSDQVIALGVFYGPEPMLINKRLVNVNTARAPSSDETWNGHLWEVP
jgi:peptide/nickel transport system substrate-binding protein